MLRPFMPLHKEEPLKHQTVRDAAARILLSLTARALLYIRRAGGQRAICQSSFIIEGERVNRDRMLFKSKFTGGQSSPFELTGRRQEGRVRGRGGAVLAAVGGPTPLPRPTRALAAWRRAARLGILKTRPPICKITPFML